MNHCTNTIETRKRFGAIWKLAYILCFTILIIISSCEQKEESTSILNKSKRYDQLIFNLALNTPYYNCPKCFVGSPENYEGQRKNIVMKENSVYDQNIDLTMNLHSWSTLGGSFPKTIIYVSKDQDFEFAFPFYDEYFYSLHVMELEDRKLRSFLKEGLTFNRHLNYTIGQLGWNTPTKRNEVNQFITLLADSLLDLKEYSDDSDLKNRLNNELKESTDYSDYCASVLIQNIERISDEIKNSNVRYFSCSKGQFGFWRFEIVEGDDNLRLDVTFENSECYFMVSL